MSFTYAYERPALTVDCVVFGLDLDEGELEVLLIQRDSPPFEGAWALPGGFVDPDEPLLDAALRELEEETSITGVTIQQLHTFGDPGRDPRGHTVSVVHFGWVEADQAHPIAADDAAKAQWHSLTELPQLAFDHDKILAVALERVFGGLEHNRT